MLKEENLIFILPFIFLIFKLLLNCINNYTEETLIDDTEKSLTDKTEKSLTDNTEETLTDESEETLTDESEETLTDESEETLTDESEETLTDDTEESETDNTEKDDNEESEKDSDEELNDYTKSNIIKLKINNKKVDIELKYKKILRYIYENEIKDGFKIIKNTLFNDIKTIQKEDKGYYYLEKIGISVRFKNSNDSFNEIINQCKINNIKLYMKIELFNGEIEKIKI
jgi:hypothetical protein